MSLRISGCANVPLHLLGKEPLPVLQDPNLWKMYHITCNYSSVLFRSTEVLAFIEGDRYAA